MGTLRDVSRGGTCVGPEDDEHDQDANNVALKQRLAIVFARRVRTWLRSGLFAIRHTFGAMLI
jgi:hypothetical protein